MDYAHREGVGRPHRLVECVDSRVTNSNAQIRTRTTHRYEIIVHLRGRTKGRCQEPFAVGFDVDECALVELAGIESAVLAFGDA